MYELVVGRNPRILVPVWVSCGTQSVGTATVDAPAREAGHLVREQLLHRNLQRFRGGLVFKAHRLCVSLNSRLESNKEEGKQGFSVDPFYELVRRSEVFAYRGTSLIRNRHPVGPYSRTVSRALWWS